MQIDIYSKPSCPQCDTAKKLLKSKCFEYNEFILGKDVSIQDLQERISELNSNKILRSAPQIIIDSTHIGDLNDLLTYLKTQDAACNCE